MTDPQGSRVSYVYHKSQDPTYVPLIIDNKLYVLTEQLSRTIVDTKLSTLLPWPETNNVANHVNPTHLQALPSTAQTATVNGPATAPLSGNVEQQLNLQKMYATYVMNEQNKVNLNANPPVINTIPAKQHCSAAVQTCFYSDNSTNTYLDNDIDMKSLNSL